MWTKTNTDNIKVEPKSMDNKQRLNDTLYSATLAGMKGKQLRVMKSLHDNTRICLVGDPEENEREIKNSTGQGTNWAPAACSLSMGQTIVEEANNHKGAKMKVDEDLEMDPLMFVDDTMLIHDSVEGAVAGGKVITDAFDELGIEAHPEKSAQGFCVHQSQELSWCRRSVIIVGPEFLVTF